MKSTEWFYEEETGRYVVKGARILFPNFAGAEQTYNHAGKRNFRLQLPEDLAEELKSRGIYIRTMDPRDETEEVRHLVKIGIYQDADIRLLSGKVMTPLQPETFEMVDREFAKGHIMNGSIDIEFHISKNTRVPNPSPYTRLDTAIIPIRKSRLLQDYEDYEADEEAPF